METLKFVMTAAFYPPYHLGGDANHVRYLAEALSAQGHEVHVEYSPAALALKRGRPDFEDGGDGGVIRHPIPAATGRFQPLGAWIFGAPPSVRRHHHELVDEVRPDVIHYHNLSLLGLELIDVPSSAPDPNPSGQASEPGDYYLYVGRLELYKGIPELAEAASRYRGRHRYVVVGKGKQAGVLEAARRRSAPLALHGWLPAAERDATYARARALLLPSIWYENAPLVAFEALAWGTPILASETGALPEILHGGM